MPRTTDRFGLISDSEAQISTVDAGWRFYKRAAVGDGAQQALIEWVDAVEAVLDLGVEPARLTDLRDRLMEVYEVAEAGELRTRVGTLLAEGR